MVDEIEIAKSVILQHEENIRQKDIAGLMSNVAEDVKFHIFAEVLHVLDRQEYKDFCENLFNKASLELRYNFTSARKVSGLIFLEGSAYRELSSANGKVDISHYKSSIIVKNENGKPKIWQVRTFLEEGEGP